MTATTESLQLVHHHPGRLRVRARLFEGVGSHREQVDKAVKALPGIVRVSHNEKIGSLLVEYVPGVVEPDQILTAIADAAGLERESLDCALAKRRQPAIMAIDSARQLNEIAYELTGWRADLRSMVPAGLAALAAYSFAFGKGPRLPRWDNLLYWSYSIFVSAHRHEIEHAVEPP